MPNRRLLLLMVTGLMILSLSRISAQDTTSTQTPVPTQLPTETATVLPSSTPLPTNTLTVVPSETPTLQIYASSGWAILIKSASTHCGLAAPLS